MPEEMLAVEITRPGGPEVLAAKAHAKPTPSSGEVLIKVAYAGVNRPDCLQRMGAYPPPPGGWGGWGRATLTSSIAPRI